MNFNTKYPFRESPPRHISTLTILYLLTTLSSSPLIGSLDGAKIKVANVFEEKKKRKKEKPRYPDQLFTDRKRETFLRVS